VIKSFYLRNLLRELPGRTIDLGCGAGQLLEKLPAGSLGLETNPALVEYLVSLGLDARLYDVLTDGCALSPVEYGRYDHLVCSHVIEHFDDPALALRKLALACERLGIRTMTFVVPGERGYRSDPTHKTFVTADYIREHGLEILGAFQLDAPRYFPGNHPALGRWFIYHECMLTWRRTGG
jgi:SAM-dependent methyltransferase